MNLFKCFRTIILGRYYLNTRNMILDLTIKGIKYDRSFLKKKGYRGRLIDDAWLHCPRYYDDENKISVMYGYFIIGYSKQEGYELLYASKNVKDLYSWTYDDSALLVCQHDGRLGCYDFGNKTMENACKIGIYFFICYRE